jgi:hypothetical protein
MNAEALAAAESRYRKLNFWFWAFLALIPLGVVLPCLVSAVAYRIAGDEWSAPIALSALLWPIVGVAGALLLRGGRRRAHRELALVRLAEGFGLRYSRRPPPESYAFLRSVSLLENPHVQSAENLMEGQPGAWPLISLDYHYAFLWGSVTEYADQTIAVFSGFDQLPPLAIVPIGILGRIENQFLGKGGAVAFPQHPEFNRSFAVVAADPPGVMRVLRPELIELLLSDRLLTVIVDQGRLLVFRRLTIVRADEYQAFLTQAYRVAQLLGASATG